MSDRGLRTTLYLRPSCGRGVVTELFLLHEVNAVDQKQGWTLVFLCLSLYLNVHWSRWGSCGHGLLDRSWRERPCDMPRKAEGASGIHTLLYLYECPIGPTVPSVLFFHSSNPWILYFSVLLLSLFLVSLCPSVYCCVSASFFHWK
jgi:hypothetical protein